MKICPQCNTALPDAAKFCFNCGTPQVEEAKTFEESRINFNQDVEKQLIEQFFKALRLRIETEHQAKQYQQYYEHLYESGFREALHFRLRQLAEMILDKKSANQLTPILLDQLIEDVFEELLDFFIIRCCQNLNEVLFSESILRWQHIPKSEIDLFQMVLDYLDFAHEPETVYTDFLIMPVDKLKNASKSFLFPQKDEKILLICDQSLFGSCKEGFALTDKAIYWKAHLQKAHNVPYSIITTVEKKEDWITINGEFFNVNYSFNIKLLKLLKKLKKLYS